MSEPAPGTVDHLPTGTVTFLFTDIEGSTRLLQALGDGYADVLEDHHDLLRATFSSRGGLVFGSEGDALFVVFPSAPAAVAAAAEAQRVLHAHDWAHGAEVKVRMGLHTGEGTLAADNYVGLDVHRTARISAAGHGGQVLLSAATRALAEHALPEGVSLRDLGEHRLKDLDHSEWISQLVVRGLPSDFPSIRSFDARPNNLPSQLTSFVGREREMEAIAAHVRANRLVTLTGPGGTGKTRLSLRAGVELLPEFADGVFFVPLAPISDPALIASTVAGALGIQEGGERAAAELLQAHLATRSILLVMDNFEQVVSGAGVVGDLLAGAPGLHVLVTSREALHLSGEQEFPVPPLALPDREHLPALEALSQYDSVALFVQRARAMNPTFAVTNENAPAVAELCARLDGLPLAIELAAARVKLFSPEALLKRLDSRLIVLASASRDLPARQRTLRGAIDWSHDLLEEPERAAFRRSAVFSGGASLEAAEEVLGELPEDAPAFDALVSLVDKSLLRQVQTPDGEPRFHLLMTIREYARERLVDSGEERAVARRHAELFRALAERAEPNLVAEDGPTWLSRLEQEHDNLRAALAFLIEERDCQPALAMAADLWRFWHLRGHISEGRAWLNRAFDLPEAAERTAPRARALNGLAGLEYWQLDYDSARAHWEESIEIAREIGDRAVEAYSLYSLSYVFAIDGDFGTGERLAKEAIDIFEQLGDEKRASETLGILQFYAMEQGRWDLAEGLAEQTLTRYRALGEGWSVANGLHGLARVKRHLGRRGEARALWMEAIDIFGRIGDASGLALVLGGLGGLAADEGHLERAVLLGGAAQGTEERIGGFAPVNLRGYEDTRELVRGRLDDAVVDELWEQGRAMSLEDAVAMAARDEGEDQG